MPLQAVQSVKVKTGEHAGRAGYVVNGDDDAALLVKLDASEALEALEATFAADELEVL